MDRFATELVMMQGSSYYGGPAGFGISTQNDAPLAEKAHILAKTFLAVELKCARCHDAPYHSFSQTRHIRDRRDVGTQGTSLAQVEYGDSVRGWSSTTDHD